MKITPDIILTLLGGKFPFSSDFHWGYVEYFQVLSPNSLQGFDGSGEPIGPSLDFTFSVHE